jgi:hypothetical protein
MSYDLRRLRAHGLIERIPGTTATPSPIPANATPTSSPASTTASGGPGSLNSPTPPSPRDSTLRQAGRAYHRAINDLIAEAGIAP